METILFFDLDGTLVENHFSRKAIGQLLGELSAATEIPVEDLAMQMGRENGRRQQDDPDNVLTMDWNDIVQQIAATYDHTLSDSVDALWRKFAHINDVTVLDDAAQVLADLKQRYRIVLATKGLSKYQDPVLEVTGLRPYFDDILTPDLTGYLKTSRDYFARYLAQDASFIQIGDHYYDDVICAKRNGFFAILRTPIEELEVYDPFERTQQMIHYVDKISTFPAEGSAVRPDAVVTTLAELPAVIPQIEAIAARQRPKQ